MKKLLIILALLPVLAGAQTLVQKRIGPMGNSSTLVQRQAGVSYGYYYGIVWDTTVSSSTLTRTGVTSLYAAGPTVPEGILNVQNQMRRCLLKDDGTVNYYLSSTNSYNKSGVLPSVTGTATSTYTDSTRLQCKGKFTGDTSLWVGHFVHNTTTGKTTRYAMILSVLNDSTVTLNYPFFVKGDTWELMTAKLNGIDGQIMVEIPKFYYRQIITGSKTELDISSSPLAGFAVYPAFVENGVEKSVIYISALEAYVMPGSKLSSVAGYIPTCLLTRATFRTDANNRGSAWSQYRFWYHSAVQILYYTEYADFNSQNRIPGFTERATWADAYRRKTGRSLYLGNASGTVPYNTVYDLATLGAGSWNVGNSYRGIENFYGHIYKWIDGINVLDGHPYISNNHATFADDTQTNYTDPGYVMSLVGGYIKTVLPLGGTFLPKSIGGASNTYVTDYFYYSPGWRVCCGGGFLSYGANAGVASLTTSFAASAAYPAIGARLCY